MSTFRDSLNPEQREEYDAAMTAETARVRAEEASKRTGRRTDAVGTLNVKVSEKGAISFYGFGRWPITVFAQNLVEMLNNADVIRDYIVTNKDALSWKRGEDFGSGAPRDEDILNLSDEPEESFED